MKRFRKDLSYSRHKNVHHIENDYFTTKQHFFQVYHFFNLGQANEYDTDTINRFIRYFHDISI